MHPHSTERACSLLDRAPAHWVRLSAPSREGIQINPLNEQIPKERDQSARRNAWSRRRFQNLIPSSTARRRTSGIGEPGREALGDDRYIDVVLCDFLDERPGDGDGRRDGTGADAVEPQEDTHGEPGGALVAVDQRVIAGDGVQQCRSLLVRRGRVLRPVRAALSAPRSVRPGMATRTAAGERSGTRVPGSLPVRWNRSARPWPKRSGRLGFPLRASRISGRDLDGVLRCSASPMNAQVRKVARDTLRSTRCTGRNRSSAPPWPQNRRSDTLVSWLQDRYTLHMMRHREDVQSGPARRTCRSEEVFRPAPGPVKGSVRHTCVTATGVRQGHQDHHHSPGRGVLGRNPRRPWRRVSRAPRPQAPRNRQSDVRSPPDRQGPDQGGVRKGRGTGTEGLRQATRPPQGRSHHDPHPIARRPPSPLPMRCLGPSDRGSPATTSLSQCGRSAAAPRRTALPLLDPRPPRGAPAAARAHRRGARGGTRLRQPVPPSRLGTDGHDRT